MSFNDLAKKEAAEKRASEEKDPKAKSDTEERRWDTSKTTFPRTCPRPTYNASRGRRGLVATVVRLPFAQRTRWLN
jgi:hypothetical protein